MDSNPELQIKKNVEVVCMLMGIVYETLFKTGMLEEEQKKKEEKKEGKSSIVSTTRGSWATPFKIVKSFLGWYKK